MRSVWENVHIATCDAQYNTPYGAIHDAALVIEGTKIVWVGKAIDMPCDNIDESIDGKGQWLTPGFIDCHTHLVYAGERINEFEQLLKGVSYQQIAEQGGGILSTVHATRQASFDALFSASKARLALLMEEGVTTIEIKSGYGLTSNDEMKMLEVAQKLGDIDGIDVHSTLLAAHALPPEYIDNRQGYIDLICQKIIPQVAQKNLASAVDAFCESIGFSVDEVQQVFRTAQQHGLSIKLHAEQLSNMHGSQAAARFSALSCDHLEYLDEEGIRAMQTNNTVAVLLPGAFYALHETKLPPIRGLRQARVPMAIATDCNPGTSPVFSLRLMANMACHLFGLSSEEALLGITRHAASALGLQDRGEIAIGKLADFALWDIDSPGQLVQEIGGNRCSMVVKNAQIVRQR